MSFHDIARIGASSSFALHQNQRLRATVEEGGQTQLREGYGGSAPTTGYLKRVSGEAGDRVARDEVLARLVEPLGRTEVSALGVEEQRVEVVADVELPAAVQGRIGTGYRVVGRFVLWDGADVLQVPRSALFRHDGGWAVFAVRDGRAQRHPVTVGRRSGFRIQITDGVTAGTRVITHPGETLTDGMRVKAR